MTSRWLELSNGQFIAEDALQTLSINHCGEIIADALLADGAESVSLTGQVVTLDEALELLEKAKSKR